LEPLPQARQTGMGFGVANDSLQQNRVRYINRLILFSD